MEKAFLQIFEDILGSVREPLVVLSIDFRVIKANQAFYSIFDVNPDETEGTIIYELGNHQWDIPRLRELLESILPQNTVFKDFEVEHTFDNIGFNKVIDSFAGLNACDNGLPSLLRGGGDVTDLRFLRLNVSFLIGLVVCLKVGFGYVDLGG